MLTVRFINIKEVRFSRQTRNNHKAEWSLNLSEEVEARTLSLQCIQ